MATTLPGSSKIVSMKARLISTPRDRQPRQVGFFRLPLAGSSSGGGGGHYRGQLVIAASAVPHTPPEISEKVVESIKKAEETCAEDATSGECAAAWDEVEELSAAASHARDKLKESDPLEEYCADNPETEECRTYED